ncbi:MAG TPA: DegQ family serine endoprotease [Deltaproteobacteria bacterium]|nr:DegQ family serine endoprotease [Deltaproteobacteria bacterium]HIJ75845.1 DegQ family serine endoprotease [Deltaproteobacteria bacterium]
MFDSIGRAAAEPGVIHSQTGSEQPVIISPFTALAEKCTPSVVNVKVTKVEKAGFGEMQIPGGPFGDFFNNPRAPQDRTVQGAGSGVIISKDGYILTNNHVVEGAKELTVTMADKGEFKAQIVGEDPKTDLAIVKIDAGENLPAADIGDSDQIKVGDWVLAIGNPFGLGDTVTSGIVSAKGRVIGAGPYDDFIQTDASINPGNSGGPLFNMKGEVIGINTAIISDGQGIGFAIPVNTAKPLIPQLEANGEVTRGYLGANIQSITPDLSKALKVEQSKGALIAEVVPGGPADKAGIKAGDVIVSFDGKPVHDSHDLPAMVAATAIGREVPITLIRNGKEIKIAAVIAKLESGGTKLAESGMPAQGKWGLQLQDLNAETARQFGLKADHGVVVAGVQPASPAYRAFIKPGDVILEVNRQAVKSVNDLKEKIAGAEGGDALLLLVKNAQGSRYVVLKG